MALTLREIGLIAPRLPGASVLSLGYPDLLATADEIEALLGVRPVRFTSFGKWHGRADPIPETLHLFEAIGATLRCIDVNASRGIEQIADLNFPCALGSYDLVLDPGTIEHCFNAGQALLNAAGAVRPGGAIFHSVPLSMANHGFYNLNPTLFHDFYTQNGWEIELLKGVNRQGAFRVPATERFEVPPEAVLHCLARRATERPLVIPRQSKYLRNPDLA